MIRHFFYYILLFNLIIFISACNVKNTNTINDSTIEMIEYNQKVRGVWLSTITNDAIYYSDEKNYKEEIRLLVKYLKQYNINNIYYQVRPSCDALYKSIENPTSIFLYGYEYNQRDIKYSEFDTFRYLIETMHDNGIKIHAWLNPYRVSIGSVQKDTFLNSLSDISFAKKNPSYLIQDSNGKLQLDPGYPEVTNHIIRTIEELVNNYDIDGIHLDDYFYPYTTFNDYNSFISYRLKDEEIEDYRRRNINQLVEKIYITLKKYPRIEFGISPYAVWNHSNLSIYGSDTKGITSYNNLYADTRLWVINEWVDYIAPQTYFAINDPYAPFEKLVKWWSNLILDKNVKLLFGQGVYQYETNKFYINNPNELIEQYEICKNYYNDGSIIFSYHYLYSSNQVINNALMTINSLWYDV